MEIFIRRKRREKAIPKFGTFRDQIKGLWKSVNQSKIGIPLPLGSSPRSSMYSRLFSLCPKPISHVFNLPLSSLGILSIVTLLLSTHLFSLVAICPFLWASLSFKTQSNPLSDDLGHYSSQMWYLSMAVLAHLLPLLQWGYCLGGPSQALPSSHRVDCTLLETGRVYLIC